MRISRSLAVFLCIATAFSFLAVLPTAQAQSRINDKDVKALMKNLHQDAKSFRPVYDQAIKKSTIRKTSQAKDAQQLAKDFEKQTGYMLDRFKKHTSKSPELSTVESTAEQLDRTIYHLQLGPEVTDRWQKIRTELHEVMSAYNIPENYGEGI